MPGYKKKTLIRAYSQGATLHIIHHDKAYVIPKKIAEKYVLEIKKT